jgi:predicted nucleic acid-binding protein
VSYLVDTNVISELTRPKPAPSVAAWFEGVADEALHLSVLTLGELRRGVEKLPAGKRKDVTGSSKNCQRGSGSACYRSMPLWQIRGDVCR